jgi:hypothetical protein
MKKIVFALALFACSTAVFAQPLASTAPAPATFTKAGNAAFAWNVTTFDFGKIKINKPVTQEFIFTNTGDIPLVVSSVKASCGCTVADYTKDPIAPGAKGFVKATYNAASLGQFTKTVTVNANTEEGVAVLTIKGEVVQ